MVAALRRHEGERAVAVRRRKGRHEYGASKPGKAGLAARRGRSRLERAVLVDPDQLHGVVLVRRDKGVRAAVGQPEGGHAAGAVERQGADVR